MAKGPKKPVKGVVDEGFGLMDEARKRTNVSKQEAQNERAMLKDKKKPKSIPTGNGKKWIERIRRSHKAKKPFLDDAERFMRMYQGDYSTRNNKTRRGADIMSVNMVYAHIESVTPGVFTGFPYVKVRAKPKTGESVQSAELRARNMNLVLNYWGKELALDEELRDVFFDTFFGPALVELGWETEVDELTPRQEVKNDAASGDADGLSEEAIQEPELAIKKDRPFVMRREFKAFYFDPDARRRKDCRWIGVEEVLKWNDFIASPLYTEDAKKKLKPQYYPIDAEYNAQNWMGRTEDRSEKEWVKIYTIWDKDTRKKFAVAEGYEGFLNSEDGKGEDWPYEIEYKNDTYPFAVHDAKRDLYSPYTWSEFKAVEPQIIEMNRIRAAVQIHVKRSIPKYIYTDAAGTRTDINKLMNARSDEATKLNNLDAIKPFEVAEIPKPLFELNQMSRDDITTVMGTSQYENQSLADTATEASIIEGRSQARKSMRSRQWEQFVVEIYAKLAQLCQQNMSEALAVEIAGPNGIEWLNVSREEIQGEFYFDIEPGIMEYKNEALRKQQLLKFIEITNGDPMANRRALLMKVAQEFDLDPSEVVTPEEKMPQGEPPKPSITFSDIDPATITDPSVKNQVVIAALRQNGVPVGPELENQLMGLPPPSPQETQGGGMPQGGGFNIGAGIPGASGKDLSGSGAQPNGNPSLPPVQGNLTEGLGSL